MLVCGHSVVGSTPASNVVGDFCFIMGMAEGLPIVADTFLVAYRSPNLPAPKLTTPIRFFRVGIP